MLLSAPAEQGQGGGPNRRHLLVALPVEHGIPSGVEAVGLLEVERHTRGPAHRQAEQQIEALAREWGVQEISAELVGLALGGMSASMGDE